MNIENQVEQVYATPPPEDINTSVMKFVRGNIGANLSHAKALTRALAQNANAALIFEDDFYVTSEHKSLLKKALADLPSDWDILYLGGNPDAPMKRYTDNLYIPTKMLGLFAYAMSRKGIATALDMLYDNMTSRPFDGLMKDSASRMKVFCPKDPICRTAPGFSIVRGASRDYEEKITSNWEINRPK